MLKRKLRMGMIGGGPGSFIGAIHRTAAYMDGRIELVCGAFSSDPEKSRQTGIQLHVSQERVYGSFKEMLRRENDLPVADRIDLVSIVTPNYLHYEPAKLALEHGFHVIVDKPLAFDLKEALQLQEIVKESGKNFCVTYTYTGYPMIKEARQQVLSGKFGKIRKIFVEYPQGWLSSRAENSGNTQAVWRTDPTKSGAGGASADIGTHAFNLAEYITGLQVTQVCADLNKVVDGRELDDDASAMLRFSNGATGMLMATQVAAGEENNLRIRVYGEKGSIDWCHNDPNTLLVRWTDKPMEIWRAGSDYLSSFAKANTRTPAGHPEGYLEAFANHYRNFADCIAAKIEGVKPAEEWLDFPGVDEGVRGMMFVEKLIESGKNTDKWMEL